MIWLGMGTALLAWAATAGRGKWRIDWVTALCAAGIALGAALSLRLYDDRSVALIVLGASAAALAVRRLWFAPGQPMRAAALVAGAAAIAFALFGPRQGLF